MKTTNTIYDYMQQVRIQHDKQGDQAKLYFVRTFGCQQNDNDSEIAAGLFQALGYKAAATAEEADIVLFNTCSIRANADDRFYGHLGSLKTWRSQNPLRRIGVMGCMPSLETHREEIRHKFPYVDFLLNAGDMGRIPQALAESFSHPDTMIDLTALPPEDSIASLPIARLKPHRVLVSIMSGCNNFCTYCIVPYARGRERSRDFAVILQECKIALQQGAKEIMLLGQNVNSYGRDKNRIDKSSGFPQLLAAVAELDGLNLVRYMTSHPKDLSPKLIDVIGAYDNIEPHIHLPLQSGSDRILKRMNRHYDSAHYLQLVRALRRVRPEITISTDLIVGFPGEDEADFNATLQIMEEVKFDRAFTFIYSPREGTPAANWENHSTAELIHERFDRLVELQNRHSLESNKRVEGQILQVLIDGFSRGDETVFSGRTRDDRLINLTIDESSLQGDNVINGRGKLVMSTLKSGDEVMAKVTRAKTFSLEGVVTKLL